MDIVYNLFKGCDIDKNRLKTQALAFAASKGVRSARNAKQFWQSIKDDIEKL